MSERTLRVTPLESFGGKIPNVLLSGRFGGKSQRAPRDAHQRCTEGSAPLTQTQRNRPGGFFVVNNLYLLDWGRWSEFGHLSEGSKGFKEAAASQWFSPARLLLMLHIYFPSRASVRLGHQSLLLSFTETPTPDWERKIKRKRSCSVWCPHAVAWTQ